jgi:hypothetical protein
MRRWLSPLMVSRPSGVRLARGALLCGALAAGMASAATEEDPAAIRWNGFLNVVAGQLRYDTEGGRSRPGYYGYDDTLSFDRQTSAALQAVKPLDDELSVTAQVFSEGRDHNYAANLRWLYLTWQPEDHSRFRIGRIGMPFYYYSDFMDVGYAYHWALLPHDVYLYNTTVVGVNYVYNDSVGPWDWSGEVITGGDSQYVSHYGYDIDTRNARGLVLTATKDGWLTTRGMYLKQTATIKNPAFETTAMIDRGFEVALDTGLLPNQAFVDTIRPLVEPFMVPPIERALDLSDIPYTYRELALRAEKNRWLGMIEWTDIRSNVYLQTRTTAWLASGGFRAGDFLWHLTYSELHRPVTRAARADYLAVRPADLAPAAQGLWFARQIAGNQGVVNAGYWYTQIAGVAWSVSASTVLKADVTRFSNTPDVPQETAGIGRNYLFNLGMCTTF